MPTMVRAIARCGAGTNNCNVERMTQVGVPVFNTPGANANAVKELVLCAMSRAASVRSEARRHDLRERERESEPRGGEAKKTSRYGRLSARPATNLHPFESRFFASRGIFEGAVHMRQLHADGTAHARIEKDKALFGGRKKTRALLSLSLSLGKERERERENANAATRRTRARDAYLSCFLFARKMVVVVVVAFTQTRCTARRWAWSGWARSGRASHTRPSRSA